MLTFGLTCDVTGDLEVNKKSFSSTTFDNYSQLARLAAVNGSGDTRRVTFTPPPLRLVFCSAGYPCAARVVAL